MRVEYKVWRDLTLEKAVFCRAVESLIFDKASQNEIRIPVYLSAGQEITPCAISSYLELCGLNDPNSRQIFIQHRGHSTYLAFGGDLKELYYELLGEPEGCARGYGGSASIQSIPNGIYGHDGLMGSHGPIATGMAFANRKLTICFTGDAAAEEDYFLASIGWASTKNLPIIYVVEDNNLSILTEKRVRRCWEMDDVANAMKVSGAGIADSLDELFGWLESLSFESPALANVSTTRLWWHAGSGVDDECAFDRLKHEMGIAAFENALAAECAKVRAIWEECSNG
mgnify:FL=1